MSGQQYDVRVDRMATWARLYAHRQWPVFPVHYLIDGQCSCGQGHPPGDNSAGKHPRTRRGCLDATTNPKEVDAMWRRWKGSNIGFATGGAAGIAVLDIDPRHGGEDTLARYLDAKGPLPGGPVVRTPSGGAHYYFLTRPGVKTGAARLGPGIDIRADGGYVILPPSRRGAASYEWAVNWRADLEEWPEWLVPPTVEPAPIRNPQALASVPGDKALAALVRTVADAPEGRRNDLLFWASARLGEHASSGRIPLDVGAAAILGAAAQAGLGESEANKTLYQGLRKVGAAA
jgi:hypothetical protein